MRFFLSILSILIISSSCTSVEFTDAQPVNKKAQSHFPKEMQGTYLIAEYKYPEFDNLDTLIIHKDGYTGIFSNNQTHNLKDLVELSHVKIKDSLVFRLDQDPNVGYPYQIEDSAISYTYFEKETVGLSDSMILKFYKGEYYLSFKESSHRYSVILMKQERNGDIGCWAIHPKKDIDLLKNSISDVEEIFKNNGKIDKYIVSARPRELGKFTQSSGFSQLVFRLFQIEEE